MMRRVVNCVQLDDNPDGGSWRWMITLEDDPSPDPNLAAVRQLMFLKEIVECPQLLLCGTLQFENMMVSHDGMRWVASLIAHGPNLGG